ncbi:MAG: DUF4982 domain-containing protein [Treponema sp.]|nr:DUF4982 domain-containing protein [Treponema sp.]
MKTLFNDGWNFAELSLENDKMFKDGNPILYIPDQFLNDADSQKYKAVRIPHDWQIHHVNDLYKNSVGFYKKTFELSTEQVENRHNAIRFEGVYMNSGVWINGKKAGEWKYGYSTFEFDISSLVKTGKNEILVIVLYQNCNTRWYSGAGIYRDVTFINSAKTYIPTDGVYFTATPADKNKLDGEWNIKISVEVAGGVCGHKVLNRLIGMDGKEVFNSTFKIAPLPLNEDESDWLRKNVPAFGTFPIARAYEEITIEKPLLWDLDNPYFYTLVTQLLDRDGNIIDEHSQHCGFKYAEFTTDKGFFLNGKHQKIFGACHHHDQGALGAAFDKNALRRQFARLKEMGVNSVRCSHNPPPSAWMDLCDEMGIMVDDEAFDMWEKPKTQFDYGNYFNDWYERDVTSWVRRDRNHPSLIMWSVGNEIYDTHMGNGFEITKNLYAAVVKNDPNRNAPVTIASNYMMTDGAQKCATQIDTVGYNYLERLYNEHHEKYKDWKIYGSETGSTVQSRGIYHFPDSLKLVTFSDGQCSTLGNCTTPWGCANTQTVIANDRDCPFSAGQYIWTGWDYIGEPTPYHTKNSFFGQIDTAGFPKDTFYLFKSEWAGKKIAPFVHLLPYWDWNEGQKIDVKAYTNADSVELFFNGTSLGKQEINHKDGAEPFGHWIVEYHKGEIKAVAYDEYGKPVAEEVKRSFEDPAKIILHPETGAEIGETTEISGTQKTGETIKSSGAPETDEKNAESCSNGYLHFIQIMTADKNGTLVENARNYITFNVSGDAELVGMDNGDSTDYDEYTPESGNSENGNNLSGGGHTHTRRLFANRLIAIVRAKSKDSSFVVTAASKDLPNVSLKYDGSAKSPNEEWSEIKADENVKPQKDIVPSRKIEIICDGSTTLDATQHEVHVTAKVLPENATCKEINWNPVLKECVASDNIEVELEKLASETTTETEKKNSEAPANNTSGAKIISNTAEAKATIHAAGDGECILRCTALNGTKYDEVLSDLPFTVTGIGTNKRNPYELIEACRMSGWDKKDGKEKPGLSLESGISTRNSGTTWIAFDKVDFGADGADSIHIPIFSFATELQIEVWDSTPDEGGAFRNVDDGGKSSFGGECLGKFTYKHESIYNTYSENVFTLSRRLFGMHTISICLPEGLYFHGFYFDKTPKAYAKLRALDANLVAGDTFTKTETAVEGIGNNVNLDFANMDFGKTQATKLTICGKSNTENNTINIKFFAEDGSSTTQVIEFTHTDDYEEKTFEITPVSGNKKISFVFLPGCNFDFKWFRFE